MKDINNANTGEAEMTTIKIIETGEVKELEIIDPKSGNDWSSDFIGNNDEIEWDRDAGAMLLTKEQHDWWAEVLPAYERAEHALHEYRLELDEHNRDLLDDRLNCAMGVDLEYQADAMLDTINWHKSQCEVEV